MSELKIVKRFLLCLLIVLVMAVPSLAQVPNCQINFGPWTDVNASAASFNGVTQCAYWVITYQVTGFSAISLAFESATGTQAGPGSFGNFTGTVATGVNPNTSVSCATPTNCTSTFTGTPGWFRVNFPSHTGSGRIQGTLQGYKTGYTLGGNAPPSGTSCPGTAATPCVVDGVTAAGLPPTTAPVMVAGSDGTNVRIIATDAGGGVAPSAASAINADAASNTQFTPQNSLGNRLYFSNLPSLFNGATWDRVRSASAANNSAAINIGAVVNEKGPRWSVVSTPGAGIQATVSKAAGAAGVHHVADCITFSAIGTALATPTVVNLRDGATGAGTILMTWATEFPALTAQQLVPDHTVCGLGLVGSAATAMTLEFGVLVANASQTVTLTGFDVQ